jgi:chromosome partitioning protein
VLIDGPPRVYDVARSAIMASDVVLIPVQPSPYDVWAAKEIVDLLKEATVFKPSLKSNTVQGSITTASLKVFFKGGRWRW